MESGKTVKSAVEKSLQDEWKKARKSQNRSVCLGFFDSIKKGAGNFLWPGKTKWLSRPKEASDYGFVGPSISLVVPVESADEGSEDAGLVSEDPGASGGLLEDEEVAEMEGRESSAGPTPVPSGSDADSESDSGTDCEV